MTTTLHPPDTEGRPRGRSPRVLLLLSGAACSLGLPINDCAADSCQEFFANLASGTPGSCSELSFFGFNGVEVGGFHSAEGGSFMAAIDLFDEAEILPDFFNPLEPVFASVEVKSAGIAGIPAFSIEHRGRVSMLPLPSEPPPGSITTRFIAASSRNKTIFRAHDPEPGIQNITIDIKLEQDFALVDPIHSNIDSDVGTSFRIKATALETGEVINELLGRATFDSRSGPEPDLGDPFTPGYDGFTNTTSVAPGWVNAEFQRTLTITIEENVDIKLETLVSESIFTDGFQSGATAAWISDSENTFTVKSQNPNVTLNLKAGDTSQLVVPSLDIDLLPDGQVRLAWNALDTQAYTVLFTPDPALPHDQWQERATVTGTGGVITRDFAITGTEGFFAIRTTSP